MNVVAITGRFVADPELRKVNDTASVSNFSIAVDRNRADKDGNRVADFFNVTAWNKTAEFISKYFHKGDMIAIEGSLQTRRYTDKDGNNRTATDIIANNVSFCGRSGSGGSTTATTAVAGAERTPVVESPAYDDLPF